MTAHKLSIMSDAFYDHEGHCIECGLPFATSKEQSRDYDNYCVIALDVHYEPILHYSEKICCDCLDMIREGECEAKMYQDIYGDLDYDDYTMSDSHRADVEAERWDWLKRESE